MGNGFSFFTYPDDKHLPELLRWCGDDIRFLFPGRRTGRPINRSANKSICQPQKCDFLFATAWFDAYVFGDNHPYGNISLLQISDALTTGQLKKNILRILPQWALLWCWFGNVGRYFQPVEYEFLEKLSPTLTGYHHSLHKRTPTTEKKYRFETVPTGNFLGDP